MRIPQQLPEAEEDSKIIERISNHNYLLVHTDKNRNLNMSLIPRSKRKRLDSEGGHDDSGEAKCFMILQQNERDALLQSIKALYQSESMCDVHFLCGGQTFHAHRVVLAAGNTFLGAMLKSGMEETTNPIEINNDPILFKYVLDYLYGVPIEVPSSLVVPLLGMTNSYAMFGMRDRLADLLSQNLCVENCCAIFAAADTYGCSDLRRRAQDIMFSNFAVASKTADFYELSQDLIEIVLGSDDIVDCDEALLFEAATRWLEHAPNERGSQSVCLSLLKLVRFPIMDSCLLSDVIKGHHISSYTDPLTPTPKFPDPYKISYHTSNPTPFHLFPHSYSPFSIPFSPTRSRSPINGRS